MNWRLEFTPYFPPWLLITLAVIVVALVLLLFVLRMRASAIRALALLCLLGALSNPILRDEERERLPSIAVVMSDESASHTITGREKLTQAARKALEKKLGQEKDLEIRWVSTTSLSDRTNLFADLMKALETVPPERLAGVVLISDGQVHDVPEKIEALGINAPIHLMLPGKKDEFDRRLEVVESPRYGIVGSSRQVTFKVLQEGKHTNQNAMATVKIRQEGKLPDIRQVEVGKPVSFDFDFPHAGQNIVEIDLAGMPGEMTFVNNRVVLMAKGVRENLRVLLVSGEPNPGERTWRNLLKSDAAVDLVHFTILRPPEKQDSTPINELSLIAFPTRELFVKKLKSFDLVIFDRYRRRGVLPRRYLENIANYVKEGGAVLMGVGEGYTSDFYSLYHTPLRKILPAQPTGRRLKKPYRAGLTESGERHPVTRALDENQSDQKAKWGKWYSLIESEVVRGDIVMRGLNNKPLLVLDRVEKGRVAMLMSDHAWLWARGHDGGGPFTNLLRRIAHWSMKEPDLEEEYLKATVENRTLMIERRSLKEKSNHVVITSPVGKKTTVNLTQTAPGLWSGTYKAKINGLYRLKSGMLKFVTHIGRLNSPEQTGVVATKEHVAPMLASTGGGAFWLGKKNAVLLNKETNKTTKSDKAILPRVLMLHETTKTLSGRNWLGLKRREAYLVKGIKTLPLFTGWLALALLLGLLSLTWYREGR